MWNYVNGKIQLDVSKVRQDFKIISENGLHFIHPKKNFFDWVDNEKWLRSIIVDSNGFVVSCSWKKFGNYEEFPNETNLIKEAITNNKEVIFTNKEDGTLCIRSVINGKIIFRTRGTMFGGYSTDGTEIFADKFKRVAKDKYPILLDKYFMLDRSLLFEYVAPDNIIVIPYNYEDLIFLGAIMHNDLKICNWGELNNYGLNLVKTHILPLNTLDILNEINSWKNEGVVARYNQIFVKIKSAHYLANHRMKYSMTYQSIAEFCEQNNIKSEQELLDKLKNNDYDWEVLQFAKNFYKKYIEICEFKNKLLDEATNEFNEFKKNYNLNENIIEVRKEYAKIACSKNNTVRSLMFLLFSNKINKLKEYCTKIVLAGEQECKK